MHTRLIPILPLLLLVAVACEGDPAAVPQSSLDPIEESAVRSTQDVDVIRTSLQTVAAALAVALADADLREQVKEDLQRSRYTIEHKLPLQAYLAANGVNLFRAAARTPNLSPADLAHALSALPPLEFYMPVPAHRNRWVGGAELLVGTLVEEHEAPVAFSPTGERMTLSPTVPPETPLFVVVLAETDFESELDPTLFANHDNAAGKAIGTWQVLGSTINAEGECDPLTAIMECDSTGGGGPSLGDHVWQRDVAVAEYITHVKTENPLEPYALGHPEFFLEFAGIGGGSEFLVPIPEHTFDWDLFGGLVTGRWEPLAVPAKIIDWDVDVGNRLGYRCYEDDADLSTTVKWSGTAKAVLKVGDALELGEESTFSVSSTFTFSDDPCGGGYLTFVFSSGSKGWIPDGPSLSVSVEDYVGGAALSWYGHGVVVGL